MEHDDRGSGCIGVLNSAPYNILVSLISGCTLAYLFFWGRRDANFGKILG